MIKAIIFDYSGVIVRDESKALSKIIKYLGITKEDWDKEWNSGNRMINTGKKPYHEYFLEVCSKFKNSEDSKREIEKMFNEKKDGYKINTELVEIIKKLKDNKFKIGLISNYGLDLRDKIKKLGIIDLFDSIIISAEVGCQKPEPEIFELSFAELGVLSEDTVFIDDSQKCLEGSDSIGYHPILFKDNESFKSELEKITGFSL